MGFTVFSHMLKATVSVPLVLVPIWASILDDLPVAMFEPSVQDQALCDSKVSASFRIRLTSRFFTKAARFKKSTIGSGRRPLKMSFIWSGSIPDLRIPRSGEPPIPPTPARWVEANREDDKR